MKRSGHARGTCAIPPGSDEGPTVAAVAPQESKRDESRDCRGAPLVGQALLVIEGEDYARAYLDRLSAGDAQPGELATILAFLREEMLHGACRVIEKALEASHA